MDLFVNDHEVLTQVRRGRKLGPVFVVYPNVADVPAAQKAWWQRFQPGEQTIQGKMYFAAKRVLDLLAIFVSLPLLVPLFVLCAVMIKIESPGGPALFRQARTGKGGRRFMMYKFRTMVPDAEEQKMQLAHLNELQWPDFKISNDPRVTRVGRWLRKTSLDELPQLLNILTGEMTLVGPRPTSFSAETYDLWHTERLDVTPGLTGLWQVIGRGSMEFDERVRLDVAYIQRRSIGLDIMVLLHTVVATLQQRGAH
jgi:lipopolysaccharide/colanic/teichoic acid biosynthesis glycosyltransferase